MPLTHDGLRAYPYHQAVQPIGSITDVMISRFGKFEVRGKGLRRGRNPQTGENLMLDARRLVTFKPSGKLREKLNGGPNGEEGG